MKILAIIGSPKGRGNTFNVTRRIEDALKKIDNNIEFEYLLLKEADLQPCKGCYICFLKGEQQCPLKDERESIEQKMKEADGVIFASPVYGYNITWMMKSFVDRFAYICHRPRFHNKKAMIICTTGAVGLNFVLLTLGLEISTWGFTVASKLGIVCPPEEILEDQERKLNQKTEGSISKAAAKFYKALNEKMARKPGFISLLSFRLQKDAFNHKDHASADYLYWNQMGWLNKETKFYYNTKINIFISVITGIIAKLTTSRNPIPLIKHDSREISLKNQR